MVTDAECVYQALAEKSDILNCRSGKDITDYDLVMGGVANDKVFNTVELYFDGLRGVKRYDSESCFASKKI